MDKGGKHGTREGTGKPYRIVLRDEVSEGLVSAFEGMQMETGGGQTILTGVVVDHSHLHSILDRIGALGLELVRVEALPQDAEVSSNAALPKRSVNRTGLKPGIEREE
jgi:hypothetical protein